MSEKRYADIVEQSVSDTIDWDDFRVFFEVVRYGSFNRAAAKLKMTQPTVSRRLLRLEKSIGVRLFDRDRRGPRLTYDGQRIYRDACAAQLAITRAANQSAPAVERMNGECKVLMGDGAASYWMTQFLAPFFVRHPNIELKLFGALEASAEKRALFDINVHYVAPADGDSVSVPVAMFHFVPFASRDYLARYGTPRDAKDLSGHRLMDLALHLTDMGSWASWSRDQVSTRTVLFTNVSGCLAEAVRCGAGIALLPTYAALIDENLVSFDVGVRFQMPVFLSHAREAAQKWQVRAVLEFLRGHVFNVEEMPWFRESFEEPRPEWHECLAGIVARAGASGGEPPDAA
jgi:DNA-binding transcriptional LysR family regulator